jgi:hypothetical protein
MAEAATAVEAAVVSVAAVEASMVVEADTAAADIADD